MITGTLELLEKGGGHLRTPESNYSARPNDVYVTPDVCRSLRLRGGETIGETSPIGISGCFSRTMRTRAITAGLNVRHDSDPPPQTLKPWH